MIGPSNAALVGGILCAITVFATSWAIPQLWNYRSE